MLTSAQKAFLRHLVIRKTDPESTLSDAAFADLIGVHEKTVAAWKAKPEFQDALEKALKEYEESTDFFKTCARHMVLEQGIVEYKKSKGAERRKWWAQLEKSTADADVASDTIDYSEFSDGELEELCLARNVSPVGMTDAEFRAWMKKEGGDSEPSRDV